MLYSALHKLRVSHWLGKKIFTDRFIGFRLLYRLLARVNFTFMIRRNGAKMKIPVVQGMGFINLLPDYERWLDRLLPKIMHSQNPVILDVGANTGQTLLKIKSLFPDSHYMGVEPNPNCIAYLKTLIKANRFQNTTIFSSALSNRKEALTLQIRYKDDLLGTTTPSFRKFTRYHSSIHVHANTGDALIEESEIQRLDLIKVDVEGGECNVLQGLANTITKFQPIILCEILPLFSKSKEVAAFRNDAASQILVLCEQLSYKILNISTGACIERLVDLSDSLEASNYLFLPRNKTYNPASVILDSN